MEWKCVETDGLPEVGRLVIAIQHMAGCLEPPVLARSRGSGWFWVGVDGESPCSVEWTHWAYYTMPGKSEPAQKRTETA